MNQILLSTKNNEDKPDPMAYRFEDWHYSLGVDQWDDPLPGYTLRIVLLEYPIVKYTPKGIQIKIIGGATKFVNLSANKKFACISKRDALESFIFRKKAQARLMAARLRSAEKAMDLALKSTNSKLKGYHLTMPDDIDFEKLNRASDSEYGYR